MGTKKENGMAWMKVDERVRARLNMYKLMLGMADNGITDQSTAIAALLDKVGAPSAPEHVEPQQAVAQ